MGKDNSFKCKVCKTLVQGKSSKNSGRCAMCYQEFMIRLYQKRQLDSITKLNLPIEKQNKLLAKELQKLSRGLSYEEEDLFTDSETSEESDKDIYEPTEDEGTDEEESCRNRKRAKPSKMKASESITRKNEESKRKISEEESDKCEASETNEDIADLEDEIKEQISEQDKELNEITLSESTIKAKKPFYFADHYVGAQHYYPSRQFQPGLDKVEGLDTEQMKVFKKDLEQRKRNIVNGLRKELGSTDAVKCIFDEKNKKVRYILKCPVKGCEITTREMQRHLSGRHEWDREKAKLTCSYRTRIYNHITRVVKDGSTKPNICSICNTVQDRIDKHLVRHHNMVPGSSELIKAKNEMRLHTSNSKAKDELIKEPPTDNPTASLPAITTPTKLKTLKQSNTVSKKFQARGKAIISPSTKQTTVLKRAKNLTLEQKRIWKITTEGWRRYHDNSIDTLTDFALWCQKCDGQKKTTADQNVQRVKKLWQAVDPTMNIFPNKLSNSENIEDFYFLPFYDKIVVALNDQHKTATIQPSTIKACFSSFNCYLRFLKTRFIYIGISEKEIAAIQMKVTELTN